MWAQFSPQLVAALHAAHLRVCAWQFVYGNAPVQEAALGAQAVRNGADCLLIDAEGQYEGKYVSAETYVATLRRLIGKSFPVALAGFPYVDYHPAFPYSVFLGPGGAQYDVPQMYWHAIGTSTDLVFAHTYEFNLLYDRPIFPLGQLYGAPPLGQVLRFRQLARLYGAPGVNWWDWQEASGREFRAIAQPVGGLHDMAPYRVLAPLGLHAEGDVVVWAQEHLYSAGQRVAIDGDYGAPMLAAVARFQAAAGLPVTGVVDPPTWAKLLRYPPIAVRWVHRRRGDTARAAAGSAGGPTAAAGLTAVVPASASLPDRGEEIPGAAGAGGALSTAAGRPGAGRP
jgi:hypothetical protein